MIPILVVIKNNVVDTATVCRNAEDLEALFAQECSDYGVEACDVNFDDGYMELEDGTSICMTWANLSNEVPANSASVQQT